MASSADQRDIADGPTREQDAAAGPTASVSRLVSDEAKAALERYAGSDLLAGGHINLIGLDAIARKLGARWPQKRELVHAHVEKTLARHIGAHGYTLKVSDTDFLVVQPEISRAAGQALCLTYLRDLLSHFLGRADECDLAVRCVTMISAHSLEAELIDPGAHPVGGEPLPRSQTSQTESKPVSWTPFVASNGESIRVSCRLEPVLELKTFQSIGYRLVRRAVSESTGIELTLPQRQRLSRADILHIDMATMVRGMDRLRSVSADRLQPSLIVPASYFSLSSQKGRSAISELLRNMRGHARQGLLCEVTDIEDVPQAALIGATSLLRPFVLRIIGYLATPPTRLPAALTGAGFHALAFDAPKSALGDAELFGLMRTAIAAARPVTRSVMIYQLKSPRQAALAVSAGASHASWASAAETQ